MSEREANSNGLSVCVCAIIAQKYTGYIIWSDSPVSLVLCQFSIISSHHHY